MFSLLARKRWIDRGLATLGVFLVFNSGIVSKKEALALTGVEESAAVGIMAALFVTTFVASYCQNPDVQEATDQAVRKVSEELGELSVWSNLQLERIRSWTIQHVTHRETSCNTKAPYLSPRLLELEESMSRRIESYAPTVPNKLINPEGIMTLTESEFQQLDDAVRFFEEPSISSQMHFAGDPLPKNFLATTTVLAERFSRCFTDPNVWRALLATVSASGLPTSTTLIGIVSIHNGRHHDNSPTLFMGAIWTLGGLSHILDEYGYRKNWFRTTHLRDSYLAFQDALQCFSGNPNYFRNHETDIVISNWKKGFSQMGEMFLWGAFFNAPLYLFSEKED